MSLLDSLTTVLYLALSVGLLSVAGYGVTRVCLRGEDEGLHWVITPIVGLAVWVLLIENLGFLGLGTQKGAPIALVVAIAFAIGAHLRVGRPAASTDESARYAWGVACLCIVLVIWPMLFLSHKDYIGFANPDAWVYFSMADYLLDHGFWDFPFTSTDISYHPILANVRSLQVSYHRVGEAYWVSSLASLLRSDTKEVYQIAHATAYLLTLLSVYAMCRLGFGLDTRQAWLAVTLQGLNAVLGLVYFQQLLPHIMGLAVLPLILGVGARLIRAPQAGLAGLLGLLLAGLFTIYPEIFLFAVVPLGAALISNWYKLDRRLVIRAGVLAIVVMIGLNPVYWRYGFEFFVSRLSARPGAQTYFYAFRPIMFPIYWGLTSHSLTMTPHLSPAVKAVQFAMIFPLACALLGVSLFGIARSLRLRERTFVAYLAAYLLMGLGLLIARGRDSYGLFKLLSYTQFLVLTALAVGLSEMWRVGDTGPAKPGWRWLAAALGAGYIGLNLGTVGGFGLISLHSKVTLRLRDGVPFPDNQAMRELRGLGAIVSPTGSVMVNVGSSLLQLYLTYYLKDVRISVAQPISYLANIYREPVPLHHSFKDAYLLEARGASRDVVLNETSEPIWANRVFTLSRFPPLFLSLVILNPLEELQTNWHPLEYDWKSGQPYRRVSNDAIVRIIGRPGTRLRVAAEVEPSVVASSPPPIIDLYANDVLLQSVSVHERTSLLSVPFVLASTDTMIRLHIRAQGSGSEASQAASSLLRSLALGPRYPRALRLKVYSVGVRPALP